MGTPIYHEPQVAAYCGVHCLNTLLQGPHFSEDDLATIAAGLDAEEAKLLSAAGVKPDAFSNAAGGGMFSLQVLERALNRLSLGAVNMRRAGAEGIRASPASHDAYVCNRAEHWWAVRKLDGQFWDLNSMAGGPRPLSAGELEAHLASTPDVYAITGRLPARRPPAPAGGGGIRTMADIAPGGGRGKWWSPAEARSAVAKGGGGGGSGGGGGAGGSSIVDSLFASAARFAGGNGSAPPPPPRPAAARGGEDADLAAAIAASLGGGAGAGGAGDDDPELAAAIAASLAEAEASDRAGGYGGGAAAAAPAAAPAFGGAGRRLGGADVPAPAAAPPAPPAAAAPPTSLPDEPAAGEAGSLTIAARLPDGSRASRRFRSADPASAVGAWVASLLPGGAAALAGHRLVSPPVPGSPVLELDVGSAGSLADAGVASGVMFNVVRR